MFSIIKIKNFRRGLATNSSSTHSIIYKNENELFEDLNIFNLNYYGRCDSTIAATREAKIKYVFANIWRNESLVKKFMKEYPEVKQYFPLAKAQYEDDTLPYDQQSSYDIFGEYSRGNLVNNYFVKIDPDFPMDYLRYIIETPDIVIVGGSDEMDFVYDTVAGHVQAPIADSVYTFSGRQSGKKNGIVKNGNYYVAYGDAYTYSTEEGASEERYKYSSGGRLRFMTEEGDPIPEYPELIDLRITNRCNHGCKFCFMNSKNDEKDADIRELTRFINQLRERTEFSIGGGNILLYPYLEELFSVLNDKGHIINVTINAKDCPTILNDRTLRKLFEDYVDGIGISVFKEEDVNLAKGLKEAFKHVGNYKDRSRNAKYITYHMVPEYLGFEKSKKLLSYIGYHPVLLLGYKETGRGGDCYHETFSEKQITELLNGRTLSVDTQFAKTYGDFIKKTYDTRLTLTENEGEYSMYVDGLTMNAYKSSYQTEKPYYVGYGFDTDCESRRASLDAKDAFAEIRKDGGFTPFKVKHYWDEEEGE